MINENEPSSATPPEPTRRPLLQTRSHSVPIEPANLTVALPPGPSIASRPAGAPPVPPRPLLRSVSNGASGNTFSPVSPASEMDTALFEQDEANDNAANECTVCFERACDSVLYTCGHMCMCYQCAQQVKNSNDPLCPICRQEIKDIIKIYKS